MFLCFRHWKVIPGGGTKFEVRFGHDAFIVDEENRTCTCRMWQLSGIPCSHAVAAIFFINKMPEDYVPHWFKVGLYKETYGNYLQPVQGMNQWPPNQLNKPLPPKPRKMPGRPKKKRKRAAHEPLSQVGKVSRVGAVMTCKKCGKEGHNKRGCKEPTKDKGKQKVDATKETTKTNEKGPSVGGFMSDARRTYNTDNQLPNETTQTTLSNDPKKKGKKKLIPIRRRAMERVTKLRMQKKIIGPGSTSKDPSILD